MSTFPNLWEIDPKEEERSSMSRPNAFRSVISLGRKNCSYKHRDFSRDRRSKFKKDGMKLAGRKEGKGEEKRWRFMVKQGEK
jgi:hypothetical protein